MHVYTDSLQRLATPLEPFDPPAGRTWIVLGSGIGAEADYRRLCAPESGLCDYHEAFVLTCNNGIAIEPAPTVYWLTDPKAVELHIDQARDAKRRGARIATSVTTLRLRPDFAPLVDDLYMYRTTWLTQWTPGRLCNGRTSGCFLTQLAAIHRASAVHLVGMSGYRSSARQIVRDYDDGRDGLDMHEMTMAYYGPMMQSVFDQSPHTRFIFHGRPNWPWAGSNVDILEPRVAA